MALNAVIGVGYYQNDSWPGGIGYPSSWIQSVDITKVGNVDVYTGSFTWTSAQGGVCVQLTPSWQLTPLELDAIFGVNRDKVVVVTGIAEQLTGDKIGQKIEFTFKYRFSDYSQSRGIQIDSLLNPEGIVNYIKAMFNYQPLQEECQNLPDGQAAITLIYEEYGTGQKSAIQRNFNFNDQLTVIDFFNGWNDNPCYGVGSGDFVIVGYRIKASKGFTSGVFRVLETWTKVPAYVIEDAVYDRGSVTVPEGKTSAFCSVNKQARTYLTEFLSEGIPEYFTGRIRLECNFAEQKCLDEIIDVPAVTDEEFINTNVFDNSVDINIGQLIVDVDQVTEQLTQITEPIPPEEPESGCECEKYQAKLIYEGLKYIQKTLDVRLSQFLIAQNEANKRLVTALVSGLQPLVTTEEEPRGIADVLNEKEFDPFIMVDTNEAFYKKLMPPEGNAWIGDMP